MRHCVKFVLAALLAGMIGAVGAGTFFCYDGSEAYALEKQAVIHENSERKGPGESASNYYYARLNERERALYRSILEGVTACSDMVNAGSFPVETIEDIYTYVLNDHPELFWVDDAMTIWISPGGEGNRIQLMYNMDKQKIPEVRMEIERRAQEILDLMDPGLSDYEKMKFVYGYLIGHTAYQKGSPQNQNIQSVFLNGASVCRGYAKSFQYLMDRLGIFCILVHGTTDEAHSWNIVRLEGDYYHVDATWGEPSMEGAPVNYGYLCRASEDFLRNRTLEDPELTPECKGTKYEYFHLNQMYFDSFDKAKILEGARRHFASGSREISMMFSQKEAYELAEQAVIGDFTDDLGLSLERISGRRTGDLVYTLYPEEQWISIRWN